MQPGKQRVGAGLALDKFAKAKISKYDKRKVIEKQRALKAKQFKKYKRLQKRLEGAQPPSYAIAEGASEARQQHDASSSENEQDSQDEQQQQQQHHHHHKDEHHHEKQQQQQQQQQHAGKQQLQHQQQHEQPAGMPHKRPKHGPKPPSQLQRLAEKTAAEKAAREQERLQREAALAERRKQLEAKKKQRSHQKHDFFKRTKHGQPVMKYRVDKILEQLQKEKQQ